MCTLLLAASPSQQPGLHSETVPPFKEKKSHAGTSRESITKLGKKRKFSECMAVALTNAAKGMGHLGNTRILRILHCYECASLD